MSTYAASDATLDQNPGLTDDTVAKGTDSLHRAEDREEGLGSNPGITDQATTQMHQGLDQATGEASTSTEATTESGAKGVVDQISETAGGLLDSVKKNLK